MRNTIQYPAIGSNGNWGAVVNENFRIIDQELKKLHNNINATQLLVGANVPYIDLNDERFFVEILLIPNDSDSVNFNNIILNPGDVVLKYYPKKVEKITSNKKPNNTYIRQQGKWIDSVVPPLYCAAYVLNVLVITAGGQIVSPSSDVFLDDVQYNRGEIFVRTQKFGSLYGDDYISVTFDKYPSMGEYYIPKIAPQSPYNLTFEKTDYVTWFISDNEHAIDTNDDGIKDTYSYSLPSIGLSTFNYFFIQKTETDLYNIFMNGIQIYERDGYDNQYTPHFKIEAQNKILSIRFALGKEPYNLNQCGNNLLLNTNWTAYTSAYVPANKGTRNIEKTIYIDHNVQQHYNNAWEKSFFYINCDTTYLDTETTIKCTFWFTHCDNFA